MMNVRWVSRARFSPLAELTCDPTLVYDADLVLPWSAGSNPRRDASQMGTVMTCGNVAGILVVDHEVSLPTHSDMS
jgi:hypothetical protein